MIPVTFAPEFFLLIGIDLFLVASVITTFLESYFPRALPYLLDVGSFIGFIQLWFGPTLLDSLGDVVRFYYCAGFALISVMVLAGANVYLLLISKKRLLSGGFAVICTVPTCLIFLFFVSAYVNAIPLELPLLPVLPWEAIYMLIFASVATFVTVMVIDIYKIRKAEKLTIAKETEESLPTKEEEQIGVLAPLELEAYKKKAKRKNASA